MITSSISETFPLKDWLVCCSAVFYISRVRFDLVRVNNNDYRFEAFPFSGRNLILKVYG
jgi:hypothetical protein